MQLLDYLKIFDSNLIIFMVKNNHLVVIKKFYKIILNLYIVIQKNKCVYFVITFNI
jgi:hypothetical protein